MEVLEGWTFSDGRGNPVRDRDESQGNTNVGGQVRFMKLTQTPVPRQLKRASGPVEKFGNPLPFQHHFLNLALLFKVLQVLICPA